MCGGVEGVCAAVSLAAQVPDATRYTRYRKAARDGLAFARSLQFTAANRNASHFEEKFRATYLYGGVHGSPTDGMLRAEQTAGLLTCELRFLESGAEKSE
jgi:hypothetical protein